MGARLNMGPDRLRCAIDIAPLGPLADPRTIVQLATAAEAAGWDGLSIWDSTGVSLGTAAADPFVSLAAVASATSRLRLIASVIAIPRRRPQLVAQAAATLDRWSGGRLTLGLGSGGDPGDFESFGESFDAGTRGAMLDESAAIVDRLLRGEKVDHAGERYAVRGVGIGHEPAQDPRLPIWIGGMRRGALRRAARYEGWIAIAVDERGTMTLAPDRLATMVTDLSSQRSTIGLGDTPVDVAVFGVSEPGDTEAVTAFAEAGATWWLESLSPMRGFTDGLLERIAAGPPRPG
jgi:alkanesulfonate monooxygenase SsuD/methylene tetrahydromethanopterin reductase-like flavin-dependent oxidoreductase (luciferase family)